MGRFSCIVLQETLFEISRHSNIPLTSRRETFNKDIGNTTDGPPSLKLRRASCFAQRIRFYSGKRGQMRRRCRSCEAPGGAKQDGGGVRFELTRPFGLPVFKTGAINRSATPPAKVARLFSHQLGPRQGGTRIWRVGETKAPKATGLTARFILSRGIRVMCGFADCVYHRARDRDPPVLVRDILPLSRQMGAWNATSGCVGKTKRQRRQALNSALYLSRDIRKMCGFADWITIALGDRDPPVLVRDILPLSRRWARWNATSGRVGKTKRRRRQALNSALFVTRHQKDVRLRRLFTIALGDRDPPVLASIAN